MSINAQKEIPKHWMKTACEIVRAGQDDATKEEAGRQSVKLLCILLGNTDEKGNPIVPGGVSL